MNVERRQVHSECSECTHFVSQFEYKPAERSTWFPMLNTSGEYRKAIQNLLCRIEVGNVVTVQQPSNSYRVVEYRRNF